MRLGVVVAALLLCPIAASAEELLLPMHGAWVDKNLSCENAFKKEGGRTVFQELDGRNTGAFIIDNNRLRSQANSCRVTSASRNGAAVKLQLECQNSMMVSNEELDLAMQPDGTLQREFKGFGGFTQNLKRCPGF